MRAKWFLLLGFLTCASLACGLAGSDIQVVATPIRLPDTNAPPSTLEATPTAVITTIVPPADPLSGFADVYASADPLGGLTLHYAEPATSRELAATHVAAGEVTWAGEAIYFAGEDGLPVRASADGQHVTYEIARPQEGSLFYEFAFSGDGSTLLWLDEREGEEGRTAAIWASWHNRDAVLIVYEEELPSDETLRLAWVSEDGETLYFDRREASGEEAPGPFPAYANLWALNVSSGEAIQLPGEPGCGGAFLCDGSVSEDGKTLLRTMHPDSRVEEPIVAYDIESGQVAARYAAQPLDESSPYTPGAPVLTPDARRLAYALAEGPPGEQVFRYFLANLITGEQEWLANSPTALRPVRWLDDGGTLVLSTASYDEWHLDTNTGELGRVSDRLYLGRVVLP